MIDTNPCGALHLALHYHMIGGELVGGVVAKGVFEPSRLQGWTGIWEKRVPEGKAYKSSGSGD